MKKRLVAVALTTIMCISLSGLPSFSISSVEAADITEQADVSAVDPWDGTAENAWYAEGKEEFTLNTPEELAGFAQLVNSGNTFEGKKILLGNDMFFNEDNSAERTWTAIASMDSGVSFEGTFDGQGHTLYNLYASGQDTGGLFGRIGEKGIVKALRVSQGRLQGAAIAYENEGWILFCENWGEVSDSDSMSYTAGICIENLNLIYGCGNYGVVNGEEAGGIAGINKAVSATIDSCWNQGTVSVTSGFAAGGIATSNYGWIYDCYNAGAVTMYARMVGGIVGGNHSGTGSQARIYNCYNMADLDLGSGDNIYYHDTICGDGEEGCSNVYSISSPYNSFAEEISLEDLKSSEIILKLQGEKGVGKWRMDSDGLNGGCAILAAQQDMKDGIYKMLPDVWYPVAEVSIPLSQQDYTLKAFQSAYYGTQLLSAVYSTDSDVFSITSEGTITPLKAGEGVVKVLFEETEHGKESSFEVAVTIIDDSPEPEPTPEPTPEPVTLPYTDVNESDWFFDTVADVYQKKLMTGKNATTFAPGETLARAQFATILYRMEDEPEVPFEARFLDVEEGEWYTEAILWAADAGVVTGYSNGNFGPGDEINREQMAAMMFRYANAKGLDTSQRADFSDYPDAGDVSDFASEAMSWCVANGIITGDNGRLSPQGQTARAVCATIISRFYRVYDL